MTSVVKKNRPFFPGWEGLFEDDFFSRDLMPTDWTPAVNVKDEEKAYHVELAAPGYARDDFDVSIDRGLLKVHAEHKEESEEERKKYTRREFHFESFTRSFKLPEDVKPESIKANYKDGVLHIALEKKAEKLPERKRIEVK
jgi:HSP20 family protein